MTTLRHMRHLSSRQQLSVVLSALYARGKRDQTDAYLRQSMTMDGITPRFLEEVFIHFSLVLGFPVMLDGLERLRRLGIRSRTRARTRRQQRSGMVPLRGVYGEQTVKLLRNLRRLHPEVRTWIVRDVYGRVFTRNGLHLHERELINVVVLSVQGLERQLQSHVRGVLRTGMDVESLHMAMKLAARLVRRPTLPARMRRLVVSLRKNS